MSDQLPTPWPRRLLRLAGIVTATSLLVAAVTLAVPQAEVEHVVFAAEHGSIYMTLLASPEAPKVPTNGGATEDNVIGGQ